MAGKPNFFYFGYHVITLSPPQKMAAPVITGVADFASYFANRESPLKRYLDRLLFVAGSTFSGLPKAQKNWRFLFIVQSGTEKDGKVTSIDIAFRKKLVRDDDILVDEEDPDEIIEVRHLTSK